MTGAEGHPGGAASPGTEERPGPSPFRVALVVAFALVVGAYGNHFRNGFHFDDDHVIEQNPYVRSLDHVGRYFTDASTFSTLPDHQTYRPLLTLSYAIDYRIGNGLDPVPFHVTQLLLHLLVGAGLFLLFRRVMDESDPRAANRVPALFAAVWFCVHTANTETVNYLSSRSDIVSTLGIVAAFGLYLWVPRSRRWHLYALPMVVGALAKTPAVMFAPLLLVYAILFEERLALGELRRPEAGTRIWSALIRCAPVLALGVATFLFVEGMAPDAQSYGGGDRIEYLRTQAWVWLHYLRLFAFPLGLTADTDLTLLGPWWDTRVVVGAAAIASLLYVAVRASAVPEWRPVAFGLLWFCLGLLPSSSVFPLAEVANEHRLYLPYGGLVLAATWTAVRLARSVTAPLGAIPMRWAVAAIVVLGAHAVGTFARNRVWSTEETLWADVVRKSPANGRAWMNYGLTHLEAGRFTEARRNFERAASLWPAYPPVHVNLGITSQWLDDTAAADAHFQTALELDPDYGPGRYFYGRYLVDTGRAAQAIEHLRAAIDRSPAFLPARHLLLDLYYVIGSVDEVRALAEATSALDPTDAVARAYLAGAPPIEAADLYSVGVAHTTEGRHLAAGVAYKLHLSRFPEDADGYNNLGWSLAQIGLYPLARLALEQAAVLSPDDQAIRSNLDWVRGLTGG